MQVISMNRYSPGTVPRRRFALTLTACTTVLASGCGNLVAGGFEGEIVVALSGDAPDSQSAPLGMSLSPESEPSGAPPLRSSHSGKPEGEVEVEFRLFLEDSEGRVVALSDDDIRVRVDLRGRQDLDVVRKMVPATRYTALQIVFTEIRVEVDSGLIIDGVPVLGEIEVKLDHLSLTVTRPLELEIAPEATVELLVDLNAANWLAAVDPVLLTVSASVFANMISVIVR